MIVVKLGGSLYDHPRLRAGLNRWLEALPAPVLLVPGGGEIADGVRAFDRLHGIGEEAAHWAALRSLTVAADLLKAVITLPEVEVLDAFAFCREDDAVLPQTWDVTSDSIALRLAVVRQATQLILLKSSDRPPGSWKALAAVGYVDPHFPQIADGTMPIEVLNFRRWLENQR